MMNDELLIDRISHAIADRIAPAVPIDIALWDAETISAYLKVGKSQVLERYAPLPGFPKAIRLPSTTGGRGHPRWKASEIIEWAEHHTEGAGTSRGISRKSA
jgi:predicted DNA-binding transcriptional regulator AlpA